VGRTFEKKGCDPRLTLKRGAPVRYTVFRACDTQLQRSRPLQKVGRTQVQESARVVRDRVVRTVQIILESPKAGKVNYGKGEIPRTGRGTFAIGTPRWTCRSFTPRDGGVIETGVCRGKKCFADVTGRNGPRQHPKVSMLLSRQSSDCKKPEDPFEFCALNGPEGWEKTARVTW